MVEMGKECGFSSNFDMSCLFTPCKTELPCDMELQPIKSPNGLLYPISEFTIHDAAQDDAAQGPETSE